MICKYPLSADAGAQPLAMPRRARIISVGVDDNVIVIFAEVFEDADTKAFDVKHSRTFVVVSAGSSVPEGAGFVGSCGTKSGRRLLDFHVYEIRGAHARDF